MPQLTDLGYIKDLCGRHGFRLSKSFGQNFIVNPGVCPRIAEGAGLHKGMDALEIGPGIGVLTKELAARAGKVVTVELDERLPPLLKESLAGTDNVKLVMGDAMKLDLCALAEKEFEGRPFAVCANLPYYITSPLLMRLLEEGLPAENITVMVQKEAAQRICAQPGTREAGAISLGVRYYAEPKLLFTVSPGSFFPPPKVTSAVIRLDVRKTPPVSSENKEEMFRVIKAAFSQRRKTAVNGISAGLSLPKEAVTAAFEEAGVSPALRPEQLTLEAFAALAGSLRPKGL
ncbi:MAG: 16S rRNA (adenine(1518)-N(6)/adenine(1519)-N(6))-dimethyltransferase RsmA [Oscillospiraceae bacterium]|nr:16S rRNA (adenine(1518)-N(6)/adenine(1519)-N(6))-dimethyltransferase RsmA [Oscillospiraceae bacterium]